MTSLRDARALRHPLPHAAPALLLAALLMAAAPVRAVDGALEINHACAAAGCFSGDAAGYPITLPVSGSYVLTSDLEPASAGGIEIAATRVDLDLGGFSIRGPIDCTGTSGATISCSGSSGTGVSIAGGLGDQVVARVHDGTVSGMAIGIDFNATAAATIENVTVFECSGTGITMGSGVIRNVVVTRNGSAGIATGSLLSSYSILDSMIHYNRMDGIFASGGTGLVRGNVIYDNGGWGLISELVSNPTAQPGYGDNTISGNDAGQVRGGTAIGDNLCQPGACP